MSTISQHKATCEVCVWFLIHRVLFIGGTNVGSVCSHLVLIIFNALINVSDLLKRGTAKLRE